MKLTRRHALVLLPPLLAPRAWAQQPAAYPDKPIKFVVGFAAGSASDLAARFVAAHVGKATGQTVIVDNQAGASGALAAQQVLRAPADGYTVLVTTQAHVTNPYFYRKLPYDTVADFVPVSPVGRGALVVVAAPDFPASNIAQLVAMGKQRKGQWAFGAGNASSRVGAELFKMQAGVDLLHVPYKSMPQVLTDLVGGQVQLAWADMHTGLPLVKAGKLKALGVTSEKRLPTLPDVATVAEQGLPGYEIHAWTAVYLPAKAPPAVAARLNELVQGAIKADPGFFAKVGGEAFPLSLAEFAKVQQQELALWGRVAKAAGIEPE